MTGVLAVVLPQDVSKLKKEDGSMRKSVLKHVLFSCIYISDRIFRHFSGFSEKSEK